MLSKLQEILIFDCKLDVDKPILIGFSGGPDSMVLLDAIHRLGYQIIIGHLNHNLRPESSSEALRIKDIAEDLRVPSVQSVVDVSDYASKHGFSIEEAARILRYVFLFEVASKRKAQAVAVGHNADDQVETVLMHLLRGAGLAGLRGMANRTLPNAWSNQIPLIRPLLAFWREEILRYCNEWELVPLIDESNLDRTYYRNRLRHDLIPYLESYNPKIKDILYRTSNILSEDYEIISGIIEKIWEDCLLLQGSGYLALSIDCLRQQQLGVLRYIIRRAIAYHCPDLHDIDYKTIQNVISFLTYPSKTNQRDLTSGLRLLVEQNILWIAEWDACLPEFGWPTAPKDHVLKLDIPSKISLGNGWELNAGILPATEEIKELVANNHDPYQAWLDICDLESTLHVRTRLSGDRFQPQGMRGHSSKLSDFMINVKMPQRAREKWPLICSKDTIIWVPGYRIHHAYRLTDNTEKVLYLQLKSKHKSTKQI